MPRASPPWATCASATGALRALEAGRAGAAARAPGRSAARWRAVDEPESGAVAGRRARARDGLGATRLGGPATDRLVDPEAAPASREGGDARAGSRVQKKLDAVVAEEAARRPDLPLEVFATDEHRLGLKPVLRRVWAPKGQRPIALGHHPYKWLHVTAFTQPLSGET